MIILDGKKVAEAIEHDVKLDIQNVGRPVKLGIISCNPDAASEAYVRQKLKAAERCGIMARRFVCNGANEACHKIDELAFGGCEGIILQLPLPEETAQYKQYILDHIPPESDVDGLCTRNKLGYMITGDYRFAPCTPDGIMRLLDYYHINPDGMNVVIIGRSELVGRPLAHMMIKRNATVTVCHTGTTTLDLIRHCKNADIVVSACGVPGLITAEMLKNDAVVIDVGISRVNGKICGDVDISTLENTDCKVTPVPGGIGPMTVAVLMEHVLCAAYAKRGIWK